jgi:hypothetical protein
VTFLSFVELVRALILNELVPNLPNPPYAPEDAEAVTNRLYEHVWQRCASGYPFESPAA